MPHVMEMLGRTRVTVKDGKVVEVEGEPATCWCPVFDKMGIKKITRDEARKNMEQRIREFGMFTDKRSLRAPVFVTFGASEVMMSGLRRGLLDATVTVCDGAGTVITASPELVQGMGAQMSGLIETEPIGSVIAAIRASGSEVLAERTAAIDQVAGLRRAIELGYRKVAATVTGCEPAEKMRALEEENGIELTLIGVHLTGIGRADADRFVSLVDIVTGCASKHIREVIRPLLQVGVSVPMFAMTQRGKELLLERCKDVDSILVSPASLPALPENRQPSPLVP